MLLYFVAYFHIIEFFCNVFIISIHVSIKFKSPRKQKRKNVMQIVRVEYNV